MRRFSLSLPLLIAVLALTACADQSFELPGVVSERRAEIATGQLNQSYPSEQMSDGFIRQMADHYNRYGAGPMYVTTTYDPKKADSTRDASRLAARINNVLKVNGAGDVRVETLPTPNSPAQTIFKYGTVTAQAPSDCERMPGMDVTSATTNNKTYKYGCGVETMMAQQVMRPADLAGRVAGATPSDGARQTAVLNDRGYYGDRAFAPLKADTASEQ
jgi:type IV pilus biogenesis protein CpaD/CtpE